MKYADIKILVERIIHIPCVVFALVVIFVLSLDVQIMFCAILSAWFYLVSAMDGGFSGSRHFLDSKGGADFADKSMPKPIRRKLEITFYIVSSARGRTHHDGEISNRT